MEADREGKGSAGAPDHPLVGRRSDRREPGSASSLGKAWVAQGALYQRLVDWFEDYDLLALPTAIVPPFDVDVRYVEQVGEHRFDNYVDWMSLTYAISLLGCPALSAPAGFTQTGLPVGLQIIAPPRGEARTLAAAKVLESATGIAQRLPIEPR